MVLGKVNGFSVIDLPLILVTRTDGCDITINTDQPVPVVITGHQVPIGTVPTLLILGE